MNKKRGIQTVLMILLLGNIALSNIITYRHLAPQKYLDYQYET
ncbi:PhrA family quorum-sensing system peptide [Streptococcus suis]|nr:PhrA family quorum-sensing system peptide [Streptococcus suis]